MGNVAMSLKTERQLMQENAEVWSMLQAEREAFAALRAQANDDKQELDTLREAYAAAKRDAELLAWVLTHPETAAEELEDAAAGEGTARENLERRIAGLAAAKARGALGAA